MSCLAGGLWRHNYFQLTCRTLTSTLKTVPLFPSAHNLSRCKPMQSSFYCSVPSFPNINSKLSLSSSLRRNELLPPTRCSSSSQDGIHSNPVEKKDRIVTIPNLLCVSRILAAPYIAYCIVNADYATAAALFAYAGATDLADGAIARRYVYIYQFSGNDRWCTNPNYVSGFQARHPAWAAFWIPCLTKSLSGSFIWLSPMPVRYLPLSLAL